MEVRIATHDDLDVVRALYRELTAEWPPPAYVGDVLDRNLGEVDAAVGMERVFLAEEAHGALGFALAWVDKDGVGFLGDLYVRPSVRGQGMATALVRTVAATLRDRGVRHLRLNVDVGNADARAVYARWGFADESVTLAVDLDSLAERLDRAPTGASFGSVHVQTDDVPTLERTVRRFVPMLPGRSEGTVIAPPRGGWIAVYDELCDREPAQLRRLARELSDVLGAVVLAIGVEQDAIAHYVLFDRGKAVDEYVSVPEHFGPRPPGEVVALAANPTLVNRLTGAERRDVRAAAVQAPRVEDLPPPAEIVGAIGDAMRIEGAGHGFADAGRIDGATRL